MMSPDRLCAEAVSDLPSTWRQLVVRDCASLLASRSRASDAAPPLVSRPSRKQFHALR